VGIRAYQWGWEYFYPKSIDLNYNVSPSYSFIVGNSLKYNTSSHNTISGNKLWKYYQNKKTNNNINTPAHLILSSVDNSNFINFINFNDFGLNSLNESSAFKKIQSFTKTNQTTLFNSKSDFESSFNKVSRLYNIDSNLIDSLSYGTYRQQTYNSLSSTTNLFTSYIDNISLDKYLNYNLNTRRTVDETMNYKIDALNNFNQSRRENLFIVNDFYLHLNNILNIRNIMFDRVLRYPLFTTFINYELDSKQYSNIFKYMLNPNLKQRSYLNTKVISDIPI